MTADETAEIRNRRPCWRAVLRNEHMSCKAAVSHASTAPKSATTSTPLAKELLKSRCSASAFAMLNSPSTLSRLSPGSNSVQTAGSVRFVRSTRGLSDQIERSLVVVFTRFYTGKMIRVCAYGLVLLSGAAWATDLTNQLQKRFNEACQSGRFMGVAALAEGGKIVFSAACGSADAEWRIPNTVDTRFRIASVTKEFTATAVLLLYQDKNFSLTDRIGTYVPGLPESWQSATIHQLLTHTSGIPIFTASPGLKPVERFETKPRELLNLVRDQPLMFPHGTAFKYNNSGYVLLGLLIENVSGIA